MNLDISIPLSTFVSRLALAGFALLMSGAVAYTQSYSSSRPPPVVLAVENIILEERYSAPYSEQGFSVTPASAVRDWVKNGLRADGTPGVIRVILLDARMTRTELKTKGGIRGWFTDDQKYRYDGRIQVRMEYQPAGAGRRASQAEAEASGFFTMPEDATVNQLEKKAADLVQDLMQRTDLEIKNNMLRHMPGVVRK